MGEAFRANAREARDIFGNLEMQDKCLDDFVQYLWDHKQRKVLSNTL